MQEFSSDFDFLSLELTNLQALLKIDAKRAEAKALQEKMSASDFWNDQKAAGQVVEKLKVAKGDVDDWDALRHKLDELKELASLGDESLSQEITAELAALKKAVESLRLRVLFSGKFDNCHAIVEINSGAGGTEACDWASMLFRMYVQWAEKNKFKLSILDEVRGEEAGIKSISFIIEGKRAYGLLRSERGVHRLVRISPFDANKRRHTSFASVDVTPEIEDDIEIEIKPDDLKIDTYRSGGAGGQHVNKTDSAVRITHIPSGFVVACQSERSQQQNKLHALTVLKSKLFERQEEAKKKNLENISGFKRKIEWGSQIRSYVLHPYLLVKDHRTDCEVHDAKSVLDGRLEDFIYAYLKEEAKG